MKVLVACEFSGVVRDAFIKQGHEAYSCDLLPTDAPSFYHFQDDIRKHLTDEWDLMIAHPPCTYLSSSGLHWNYTDTARRQKTFDALTFVNTLLSAPIKRIALENPVGCISTHVREPDQYIQPYEYGHDASKKTCLWLKNLPKLKPTKLITPRLCLAKNGKSYAFRWGNQTDSGQNKLSPSKTRAKERSFTYQGWADAMAEQWG